MKVSLDSNILVYAIDTGDPDKHRIATDVIRSDLGFDCVLTTQALGEVLNVMRRLRPDHLYDVTAIVSTWIELFPVISTTADHMLAGADLAHRYRLQFWDSVILSASASAGASILLSEDMQDGQQVGGVRVVNPFVEGNLEALAAIAATPSP